MKESSLDEQRILSDELIAGERVLWSGKPLVSVIFHPSDWMMIPMSLMFGGFSLFWEWGVTGHPNSNGDRASWFSMLWGVPFIVAGQYMIWGRFLYAAWRKTKILYALTDRRALTIVSGFRATTIASSLRSVGAVKKDVRSDGVGTIYFGDPKPMFAGRGGKTSSINGLHLDEGFPVFLDIEDARTVYSLAAEQLNRLA